ncbi:MAG: MGMT family protein [Acidobacteriota bacterium]|nr:MGMT family protein [Acidobacteriota bacterium]
MPHRRPSPPSSPRVHGDVSGARGAIFEEVFALVRRVPKGRVMTYGQIATLLGNRISPRAVGWAMHQCPRGVPWQRVVNARGACSTDKLPDMPEGLQRALLQREGIEFSDGGRLDLARHRWSPPRQRKKTRRP